MCRVPIVAATCRVAASVLVQRNRERCHTQEWNGAKDQRGQQAQGERERHDDAVHLDFLYSRQRDRAERDEESGGAPCQSEAQRAAGDREQCAFSQEVTGNVTPAGPERAAYGHLALSRFGSHQKQVGDVRAGDEQYQCNGRQENPERARHAADHEILQWLCSRDDSTLIRGDACKVGDQTGELRARRRHRDPFAQPRDARELEQERRVRPCRLSGQPHLDAGIGECERRGHDSDDSSGHAVDDHGPADDVGVAAEAAHPKAVRQHRNGRRARNALLFGKPAAQSWSDAQN